MKYLLLLLLLSACARTAIKESKEALRKSESFPAEFEDFDLSQFQAELQRFADFYKNHRFSDLQIGERKVSKADYEDLQQRLLEILKNSKGNIAENLSQHFDFYEVYGSENWSEVLLTAYYEPILKGSLKPTEKFSQALYRLPDHFWRIELDAFAESHPKLFSGMNALEEKPRRVYQIAARLDEKQHRILPFFTREEIDGQGLLQGKGLELFYVDPIDAFFLHIQGSGSIQIGDQFYGISYAGQNGYPYFPIGRALTDAIPIEEMSMQRIRQHLRALSPKERDEIFFLNQSYIFFQKRQTRAKTSMGAEVSPGRTIATDSAFFPKGLIGILEMQRPVFDSKDDIEPSGYKKEYRFVINQDSGGAIKGPGRVDLFWGSGNTAAQFAGVIKQKARLWFLAPKVESKTP